MTATPNLSALRSMGATLGIWVFFLVALFVAG
jgi:hypothetical protein